MPDIVSRETRSRMMSGIRGKNTKPELLIRSALHRHGFRYRLHPKNLPGKPDIALPRHHAVIFVHGCFWHGHDCSLFTPPDTRRDFWAQKIDGNRRRDATVGEELTDLGWRRLVVWECALRGRHRLGFDRTIDTMLHWLASDDQISEVRGTA